MFLQIQIENSTITLRYKQQTNIAVHHEVETVYGIYPN